jgi:hypothetical protein
MAVPKNLHARRMLDWEPVSEQARRSKNLQRSGIQPDRGWSGRFPTEHPIVDRSNVRLASIEDEDGTAYAIPTMINGEQMPTWVAEKEARGRGLKGNYPSFRGGTKDAERFIAEQHGNFDERGRWTAPDPPRRGVGQQVMQQMSMTDPNYGLLDEEGNPFLKSPFARGFMGGTAHLQKIAASALEALPLESGGLLKGARENLRARSGAVQDWYARTQPREGEYSIGDHISEFGGTTVPTLAMYAASTATTGPIAGFAIPGLLDREEGADLNWAEGGKGALLGGMFRVVQPYNRAVSAAVVGLLEGKLHPPQTKSGKPPETAKEWISYLTGPGIMGIFAALGPAHKGGSVFGPAFTAAQLEGFRFNPNALKTHPSELSNMSRKDFKTHTDSLEVHAQNIDGVLKNNPEFVEDPAFKKHMDLVIQRQIDARRFEEGNAGGPSGDGAFEETDAGGPSGQPDAPGSAGRRSPEGEQPGSQEPSPPAAPSVMDRVSDGELQRDFELRQKAESDPTFFNQERVEASERRGELNARERMDRQDEVRKVEAQVEDARGIEYGREGDGTYPHMESLGGFEKYEPDGETYRMTPVYEDLQGYFDFGDGGRLRDNKYYNRGIKIRDARPNKKGGRKDNRRGPEDKNLANTRHNEWADKGELEVSTPDGVIRYDMTERAEVDRFLEAVEVEDRQGGYFSSEERLRRQEESKYLREEADDAGISGERFDDGDVPSSAIAEEIVDYRLGNPKASPDAEPRLLGLDPDSSSYGDTFTRVTSRSATVEGQFDVNVNGKVDLVSLVGIRRSNKTKVGDYLGEFIAFDADGSPVRVNVPLGAGRGRGHNRKFEVPMQEAAQKAADAAYENRAPTATVSEKPAESPVAEPTEAADLDISDYNPPAEAPARAAEGASEGSRLASKEEIDGIEDALSWTGPNALGRDATPQELALELERRGIGGSSERVFEEIGADLGGVSHVADALIPDVARGFTKSLKEGDRKLDDLIERLSISQGDAELEGLGNPMGYQNVFSSPSHPDAVRFKSELRERVLSRLDEEGLLGTPTPRAEATEAPVPGRRKILVSCTGAKCPVAEGKTVAAEDLYTGDAVKDAKRASKKADAEIGVIISAKHGVLDPKQQVKPYDQKLPKSEKEALKIVSGDEQLNKFVDLMKRGGIPEEVYLHGSKMYRLLFNDLIERAMNKQLLPQIRVVEPKHKDRNARQAGRAPGIGEQKAQLKAWSESDPGVQFRPIGTEFSGEGTGKFEWVTNDAGKEFRITSKDSLGDQVLYHGGAPGIGAFDSSFGRIDSLFGKGVYLTDSRTIAESYAKKIKGGGEVYPVRIQFREILDFDGPIPNEAINVIYREAHEEFRPMIREEARKDDATGSSIWERLTEEVEADSHANRTPDYEYEDMFSDIEAGLVREGWDAITHVGGQRAGKGKELHRVVIALDPTDWGGWRGTEGLMPHPLHGKSGTTVHKVEEGPGRAEAAPTPPPEAQAAEPPRPPPTEAGAEGPPGEPPPPPPPGGPPPPNEPPPPGGRPPGEPPGEPPRKPPGGAGGEARSAAEELLIEQQATDMVDLDQAGVAEAMDIPQAAVEALESLPMDIAGEMSAYTTPPSPETVEQLVSLGLMDAEGNLTSRGEVALRARQKKFEAGKEIIHSGQQLDFERRSDFVELNRLQTIENTVRPSGNWRDFGAEDFEASRADNADNLTTDEFARSSAFAQQERRGFDEAKSRHLTNEMDSEFEKKLSRPLRKDMQKVLIDLIREHGFTYEEGGRSLRSQFTELLRSGLIREGALREIADRHGWSPMEMMQIWGADSSEAARSMQELSVIADYMRKEGIRVEKEDGKVVVEDTGPPEPGSIGSRANRYIMNIENVRRGGLVLQISTFMRNMEQQLLNQGVHAFEEQLDYVMKYGFEKGGMSEFAAKIQPPRAGEALGNSMENLITSVFSLGTKRGKARQLSDDILSRFPKDFAQMFSSYMSDVSAHGDMMTPGLQKAQKVVNFFNTFNRWQEFSIRSGVFNAEIGRRVELDTKFAEKMSKHHGLERGRPVTLQWLEENGHLGKIPRKHVTGSVQKGLESTYAADFVRHKKGEPYSGPTELTARVLEILRMGPSTVFLPFPRFMANSLKWQLERNPLSVLRYMSKNQRQAFMDGDVSGISKWITGGIMFGIAYGLRTSDYAGSSWDKAKAGKVPASVLGIEEGAEISLLPYSPMSGMLFWAEYARQGMDEGIYSMSAGDIVKALTSSNMRAGLGLYALDSLIEDTTTRFGDWDKMAATAGTALGTYSQGFTMPMKMMGDLAKAMDKDLRKVKMVEGNDFAGNLWGSAMRNVPQAVEDYPDQQTLLPIGIPPMDGPVETAYPGLKFFTGILASPKLNALQEQAKEVDFTANEMIQGSGNRKWDNLLKEYATRHLIPLARVMQKNGEWFAGIKWNDMSRPARHAEIKNQLRKSVETAKLEAMDTHPDLYAEMMEGREPKRTRELRESIEEHRQNAPPVEEYRPSFFDLTDEQIEALQ